MTAEKCPNCGAALTANVNKCTYCGTVLSNAPASAWTRVKMHLPPVSPSDPGRSIPVLVTNCNDGLFFKQKDGSILSIYNIAGVVSAYFDFNTNTWKNDILGKRYGKIHPSHWSPLPDINSPDWILATDRKPTEPGKMKTFSKDVLVCDKSNNYYQSIIIAKLSLGRCIWDTTLLEDDPMSDTCNEVSSTHWMQLPTGPQE
jgi:hypothetical protein